MGLFQGRFCELNQFDGCLASMLLNKATVESDFSLIDYEKNDYRHSLTDFSIEGILRANQFEAVRALSAE